MRRNCDLRHERKDCTCFARFSALAIVSLFENSRIPFFSYISSFLSLIDFYTSITASEVNYLSQDGKS